MRAAQAKQTRECFVCGSREVCAHREQPLRRLLKTASGKPVDACAKSGLDALIDNPYTELLQELQGWSEGKQTISEVSTAPTNLSSSISEGGNSIRKTVARSSKRVPDAWEARRRDYVKAKAVRR